MHAYAYSRVVLNLPFPFSFSLLSYHTHIVSSSHLIFSLFSPGDRRSGALLTTANVGDSQYIVVRGKERANVSFM
jgi:hypothetical protein